MGDEPSDFARAVREGLTKKVGKTLPCKFIYDAYGSKIFEEVSTIEEYYPTQTELNIIVDRSDEIARLCGPRTAVIEMGSGSSIKTRHILDSLIKNDRDLTYFPIDISSDALRSAAAALKREYPRITINPLEGEYESLLQKVNGSDYDTVLVLWLGTSIGNFEPDEADGILCRIHDLFAANGMIIVGIDLKKDRSILERAYNDASGVTARFNLNLLGRINRELGGHFDLNAFEHRAFYNQDASRIEMHIMSRCAQTVAIDRLGINVRFAEGETIHTENSYKFSKEDIAQVAGRSGFQLLHHWCDSRRLFSVNVLRAEA
jgi:dimethylhistidine N-methyltransferase